MKWKNKYNIIAFSTVAMLCIIVIYLNLLSHKETNQIYMEQTEKTVISNKKVFLKDTVDNIFNEIDRLREAKYISYKKNTEVRAENLQGEYHLSEDEFVSLFKEKFSQDINNKMWTAFLWNEKTGEILFQTSNLEKNNIQVVERTLRSLLSSSVEIEKDNIKGIFGVSKIYIEEMVKVEAGDLIRSREFSGDSYIWVNEIVDYEGGENYAICRINPNSEDAEGQYLSTKMQDSKGNFPLLEELEGIKSEGELFYTYSSTKKYSSGISKKIVYAKLYKDYNWIIAMGEQLEDVDVLIQTVNKEVGYASNKIIINLVISIFMALVIGFLILFFTEKKHFLQSTKDLQKKINVDSLTKAISRGYGEVNLTSFFKQYKTIGEKPAIMVIDIDDFKQINDKYGHNMGDVALKETVITINRMIRSYDKLIRWGGDEFVVILPGLGAENCNEFIRKIIEGISYINIPINTEMIKLSISIGLSYFKETDSDYRDVIKRADEALYQSKAQGKNKGTVLL